MYGSSSLTTPLQTARATLRVCPDNDVLTAFFSQRNVNSIHVAIRTTIKERYNVTIGRQSDTELEVAMMGLWNMYQTNVVGADINCQVRRLNQIVVDWCVENIMNNIRADMGYLRDVSRPYTLLDRPVNTSQKGEFTAQTM